MTTERLPAVAPRLDRLIKRRQELGMPEPGPVDMGVLQTILLDEIAGRLDELGEAAMAIGSLIQKMERQMEKAPVGVMRPFPKTIIATENNPERWEIIDNIGREACSYAVIDNRGDNSIWVCLNDIRNQFKQVRKNESIKFDYLGHNLINMFFFYTVPGGSSEIEITLEF